MAEVLRFFIDHTSTPLGELVLVVDDEGRLRAIDWTEYESRLLRRLGLHYGDGGFALEPRPDPGGITRAMTAYFKGDLGAIDGLPVQTAGTPFQRAVWAALRTIPCGTTVSYAEVARRIQRPTAVRAVGLANNANPVGIVVPCHRVVGSNGALTGYGGGIDRKRWLLTHESAASTGPLLSLSLQ